MLRASVKSVEASSKTNGHSNNSVTQASPSSKKRRKRSKKKRQNSLSKSDNDEREKADSFSETSSENDINLQFLSSSVSPAIKKANDIENDSINPIELTIQRVLDRSTYSRDKVAACVVSMWDSGLRYDDPDAVLVQLASSSSSSSLVAWNHHTNIPLLATSTTTTPRSITSQSPPGVNEGTPIQSMISPITSVEKTSSSLNPIIRDKGTNMDRLNVALSQTNTKDSIDSLTWWIRNNCNDSNTNFDSLINSELLQKVMNRALSELRQTSIENRLDLRMSFIALISSTLKAAQDYAGIKSINRQLHFSTLSKHIETILDRFLELPLNTMDPSSYVAQRIINLMEKVCSIATSNQQDLQTQSGMITSFEHLTESIEETKKTIDALPKLNGTHSNESDLQSLFIRRDLEINLIQLQLESCEVASGRFPSSQISVSSSRDENEIFVRNLNLSEHHKTDSKVDEDKKSILIKLQHELEECSLQVRTALARQTELTQQINSLQREIDLTIKKGPELTPKSIALLQEFISLESLVMGVFDVLVDPKGLKTLNIEDRVSPHKLYQHAAELANTQAQCVSVLTDRILSSKKRVNQLNQEFVVFHNLSMKAMASKTQSKIDRLEQEQAEDSIALTQLQDELCSLLTRLHRIHAPNSLDAPNKSVESIGESLQTIARSLRSTSIDLSSAYLTIASLYNSNERNVLQTAKQDTLGSPNRHPLGSASRVDKNELIFTFADSSSPDSLLTTSVTKSPATSSYQTEEQSKSSNLLILLNQASKMRSSQSAPLPSRIPSSSSSSKGKNTKPLPNPADKMKGSKLRMETTKSLTDKNKQEVTKQVQSSKTVILPTSKPIPVTVQSNVSESIVKKGLSWQHNDMSSLSIASNLLKSSNKMSFLDIQNEQLALDKANKEKQFVTINKPLLPTSPQPSSSVTPRSTSSFVQPESLTDAKSNFIQETIQHQEEKSVIIDREHNNLFNHTDLSKPVQKEMTDIQIMSPTNYIQNDELDSSSLVNNDVDQIHKEQSIVQSEEEEEEDDKDDDVDDDKDDDDS